MFNAPYKLVNGLLSAKQAQHSHADGGMEGMFMMMKMLQELSGQSPKRFRRQADDLDESSEDDGNLMNNNDMSDVGELELGDKLIEKLRCMKEKYEAKVGNETCVMHEMGMLDGDHEIDLQGMLAHMEQMNQPLAQGETRTRQDPLLRLRPSHPHERFGGLPLRPQANPRQQVRRPHHQDRPRRGRTFAPRLQAHERTISRPLNEGRKRTKILNR